MSPGLLLLDKKPVWNQESGPGNYFADRWLELRWGRRYVKSFAEHGFGFVEKRSVFAEERDQGLT
jgi:1,6-anhydro-N-acetylmuramate kinase